MKFLISLLGFMIGYMSANIIVKLIERHKEKKILNKIDKIRRGWYGYE